MKNEKSHLKKSGGFFVFKSKNKNCNLNFSLTYCRIF